MNKNAAVATAVHAIKAARLPIYKAATTRRAAVPGVAVRLGHRRGTVAVFVNGPGVSFDAVRDALAGWREVYVNERGECLCVAPVRA